MIIVTGGAGFIGSNLIMGLNARGYDDILVVDNLTDGVKYRNLVDCRIADYMDKTTFLQRVQEGAFHADAIKAIFHQGACSTTTEWNGKYMMDNNYESYVKEDIVIDTVSVMTSGNLLNLVAFKKTGKFNEKYFIDYVDHEYCFRLQRKGFCIKIFKGSVLLHKLGNMEIKKFLGSTVCFTNHNYIRRYYMTRNRLDLAYNYFFSFPEFILQDFHRFFIEWKNILLFEENKIKKQKSIILGIIHFLIGKYGKYDF